MKRRKRMRKDEKRRKRKELRKGNTDGYQCGDETEKEENRTPRQSSKTIVKSDERRADDRARMPDATAEFSPRVIFYYYFFFLLVLPLSCCLLISLLFLCVLHHPRLMITFDCDRDANSGTEIACQRRASRENAS